MTISPLSGWTNHNYRIEFKNQAYVLRIAGVGSEMYIDRQAEEKNINLAAHLGITTAPLFHDSATGIQLRPFIEGDVLDNQLGALPAHTIGKIGEVLRLLHNSPCKFTNKVDNFTAIDQYKTLIQQQQQPLDKAYDDLYPTITEIRNKLAAVSGTTVPCHNDPNLTNFILTPENKLFLMDWEYAGNGDAAWDLGYLSSYGSFTSAEDDILLSAYQPPLGRDPYFLSRMLLYKPVSGFISALWIRLQIINGHFPVPEAELEEAEYLSLHKVQENFSDQAFQHALRSLPPLTRMGTPSV